jgi:heme/copper-type cytochrome/quinol oxidase subunit 1
MLGGRTAFHPGARIVYTLVRRFIKTGIGFLGLGLALGVYMLARRELRGAWPHPYLVNAHAHAMLAGFVLYLILGVALWLFPRAERGDTRYRPERIEAAYWILTAGTVLRIAAEASRAWTAHPGQAWVIVAGGAGQAAGTGLYFWTMWSRIRPVGSHLREARGERF